MAQPLRGTFSHRFKVVAWEREPAYPGEQIIVPFQPAREASRT
jgi:hypothetical protein